MSDVAVSSPAASGTAPDHAATSHAPVTPALAVPGRSPAELLVSAHKALGRLAPLLNSLAAAFAERGASLYLVGGSVRDALLGDGTTTSHDLDFTTPARPDVTRAILDDWAEVVWDTGIAFGTLSAEKRGMQVEITTFRADSYDGESRNPEVSFGDTLEGDLVRRDFTVNAMAVEWTADGPGEFCDPLHGLEALSVGTLDTPDSPDISFGDDPLRMLRAARFASQLGLNPAARVIEALERRHADIRRITPERVRAELDKLMLGAHPRAGLDLLCQTGLADEILPELADLRTTQDEHRQHKDIYAHSLTVLEQAIDREPDGPDLVLRWAALLHDCGKPATKAPKPGGGVTFYHHEVVGARMVRKRLRALTYPKKVIEQISGLVFLHMRFHGYGDAAWTDSAVRRYVTDAGALLPRLHLLVRADCTTRNRRRAARLQRTYDGLEERIEELRKQEDLAAVRPDLNGNDIMRILDLPPGPEVGRAWAFLKELRLEHGPLGTEEAEARLRGWWAQRNERPDSDGQPAAESPVTDGDTP